jgi:hypothetical protein
MTTPGRCGQAQHPLHSSDYLSSDCDRWLQPTAAAYDNSLQTLHLQATDGSVSQPQPLQRSSLSCTPLGPEQWDSTQAKLPNNRPNESDVKMLRRQRNSAAARKYRQKRLDRIEELEQALQKTQTERDELKVQVARWKGKAEALQSLVARSGVDGMASRG